MLSARVVYDTTKVFFQVALAIGGFVCMAFFMATQGGAHEDNQDGSSRAFPLSLVAYLLAIVCGAVPFIEGSSRFFHVHPWGEFALMQAGVFSAVVGLCGLYSQNIKEKSLFVVGWIYVVSALAGCALLCYALWVTWAREGRPVFPPS